MKKFFLLLVFAGFFNLNAGEWHVDKSKYNNAKYISSVSVLTFEGDTDKIDGYIYWEDGDFQNSQPKLYFEVDLNTLDSGIGKRDTDMREVLQTEKWQYATFDGNITEIQKVDDTDGKFEVTATGKFFVNGKDKEISVKATISTSGENVTVHSEFSIYLADYQVEAPSLLAFVKVAEEIKIQLDFNMKNVK